MADDKKDLFNDTLFGKKADQVIDALEAIYKKQREHAAELAEIKTHILAMRTQVVPDGAVQAADPGGDAEDGIPPLVKWALTQPWGTQLMHSLTDQQMISGLVKTAIDWLKDKASAKVAEKVAEAAAQSAATKAAGG